MINPFSHLAISHSSVHPYLFNRRFLVMDEGVLRLSSRKLEEDGEGKGGSNLNLSIATLHQAENKVPIRRSTA